MPESSQKSDFRQSLVSYAARILTARPYFRSKLKEKLFLRAEKLHYIEAGPVISSILDDLSASGYLNDLYLAEAFTRRQLTKGYGPKIISLKLRQLGLEREIINSVIKAEVSPEAEIQSIKKIILKYPRLDRRKLVSKLYTRGYSGQTIREVFDGEWLED